MKGKIFFDTNFLLYLFSSETEKYSHCVKLLDRFRKKNTIVWSTQVLQEFYSVLTVKYKNKPQDVKRSLLLFDDFELIVNNKAILLNAIDIQTINHLSFWDSLIISAAQHANCGTILTEDLNSGQQVNGILIQNPFELKL